MTAGSRETAAFVRHSTDTLVVPRSMTIRAALPLVRALILAGLAVVVILFGLPAILAFGAASPL